MNSNFIPPVTPPNASLPPEDAPKVEPPVDEVGAAPRPRSRHFEGAVRSSLDTWDVVRGEAVRGWKILLRLLKGSQLTQERRKLLEQLGTLAADRLRDGRWAESEQNAKVTAMMDQLDRLDRKIRLEERLIAQLRARSVLRPPPDDMSGGPT